jgi:hypothetical protein
MDGEHFGMAVAEMVRAGCTVFALNNGGPVEMSACFTVTRKMPPKKTD